MDKEQATIDVKALPEGMEELARPDLEQTAKAQIAPTEPSLAEEVAATGTGVIEEVQNNVVGYLSGTDYANLEPLSNETDATDKSYKSTPYGSSNQSSASPAKVVAPPAAAVATKPVKPPEIKKDESINSGGYQSGVSYFSEEPSGAINSSFNSGGVASIGEPDKAPQLKPAGRAPQSTAPYVSVDQRPSRIEARVGSPVSRDKWKDQTIHKDFQLVNTGVAAALLIILPIIFFMPIMFSSIPGFLVSAVAIGFFVNLGRKLNTKVVDTEWNKFASWVYEKKASDRREVFLSFIQPPYLVNQIILMEKPAEGRAPMLGLKLHVKKSNLNHEIWQGMERYYAGDTKYAARVYMDHSDDLEAVIVEIGDARFWCIPEVDY